MTFRSQWSEHSTSQVTADHRTPLECLELSLCLPICSPRARLHHHQVEALSSQSSKPSTSRPRAQKSHQNKPPWPTHFWKLFWRMRPRSSCLTSLCDILPRLSCLLAPKWSPHRLLKPTYRLSSNGKMEPTSTPSLPLILLKDSRFDLVLRYAIFSAQSGL